MKKIYMMLALMAGLFSSCFDDDGNYKYTNVEDITIEGISESYINNSYNGEVLEIDPVITSNYTDLQYEWWMWNLDKEGQGSGNLHTGTESELISTEKKLSYPVECPIGRYQIMLKVISSSNGYFNTATTVFDAQTLFTRGFYILNENSEGNTELDLYDRDGTMRDDLLAETGNGAMKGKPRMLGALPSHSQVLEDNSYKLFHSLCVTTEDNQIAYFNVENMEKVHDATDIVTGGLDAGEIPYASFTFNMSNFLITSGGSYTGYIPEMMPSSGAISIPASGRKGGSRFVICDNENLVVYWSNEESRIDCVDGVQFGDLYAYDENGFSTEGMECLACGSSFTDGKGYFLLKDGEGKQFIYEVSMPSITGGNPRTTLKKEISDGSKLASATTYAFNSRTTNLLYFASGNQVYTYILPSHTENPNPLTLEGIGADETITYLSYQWQEYANDEEYNFTYFVVGTQKGDTYKLYMYTLEAGIPKDLVEVIEGKGKLNMCTYMTSALYYNNETYEMGKHSLPN